MSRYVPSKGTKQAKAIAADDEDVDLVFHLFDAGEFPPVGNIVGDASVVVPAGFVSTSASLVDIPALTLFMGAFQAFGLPIRSVATSDVGRAVTYSAHGMDPEWGTERLTVTGDGDTIWVVAALDGWTPAELPPHLVQAFLRVDAFRLNIALHALDVPACKGADASRADACIVQRNSVRIDAAAQFYDVQLKALGEYKRAAAARAQREAEALHARYVAYRDNVISLPPPTPMLGGRVRSATARAQVAGMKRVSLGNRARR